MTPLAVPLTRDLVLVGGGHTHALVLRRWAMAPLPGVRVTLIDPTPAAAYSGMLPGHVAGHYTRDELDIDLVRLARAAGARLILGRAEGLDPAAGAVHVTGRPPIRYDRLSLDIGITSEMPKVAGFAAHAVPAKPLGPFAARWEAFVDAAARGAVAPRVAVIGAGIAGAELSMAMAHRLRSAGCTPEVRVIDAGTALPGVSDRAARLLRAGLAEQGVELIEGAGVAEIGPDALTLADGRAVPFAFCCGAAGAKPHPWLAETGLHLTGGFVTVDDQLRSLGDHAVYAVGDCAHLSHAPRPKAGVYAVREAPILDHNLRADLAGFQRRRYRPQGDYLKLISLGGKAALADRRPLALAAPWLWRLKDRIDRDFMAKFDDLPRMAPPPLPDPVARGVRGALAGDMPLCGGCGAKLGPEALAGALAGLAAPQRADVAGRPGDDAAILLTGGATQVISTDHLRAVVDDPWLMARIATMHALGDIWAMGAAPQAGLLSVTLPRMRGRMQEAALREVTEATAEALREAGAELAGGHSTQGAEMVIGLTVTGLCDRPPVTLAGARPGDALILTRPVGSGLLLAAEMRGKARGRWIAALWERMAAPQDRAAAILAPVAHAMTDVTGFGLGGHALAMAEAGGVAVRLLPDAVPFYPGAAEMAAAGIRSTLHAANAGRIAAALVGALAGNGLTLLADPQTSGGLLAAVPQDRAGALVAALREAGMPETAIMGHVEDGPPRLRIGAIG